MKEISIEADQIKRSTISDLRTAAENDGIFGDEIPTEIVEEKKEEIVPTFTPLQTKYICTLAGKTLTIKLAENTKKETLLEIKSILESSPSGEYNVWLDIGGKMIDTKKSIRES